jgi:GntR family transcriptional regulator, vanillate catabolism transcriptional regulator
VRERNRVKYFDKGKPVPLKLEASRIRPVEGKGADSQTARATLALRELLLKGRFQPGERIREVPLSAELSVSRIPLRIALERLSHEGLLEVRPTTGFVVAEFCSEDIYEAIALRGVLEGRVARLAADRLTEPRQAAKLHSLSHEMIALFERRHPTLDMLDSYIQVNSQFHQELLRLSGSRILRRAMIHVCSLPFASPSSFLRRHYLAPEFREMFLIAVDQHRSISDAIQARDGDRADSLMQDHARLAWRNLEFALKDRDLAKFVPGATLIRLGPANSKSMKV